MAGQFDPIAQFDRGGVTRRGDPEHAGEVLTRGIDIGLARQHGDAQVAQLAHPRTTRARHAQPGLFDRVHVGPDAGGAVEPVVRGFVVVGPCGQFGLADERAFGRGEALHRARIARAQLQRLAEGRHRAGTVEAELAPVERRLAAPVGLHGVRGPVDLREVVGDRLLGRRHVARDRGNLARPHQRGRFAVDGRQRRPALLQQRARRGGQPGLHVGIVRGVLAQREVQRDGVVGVAEQLAGRQCRRRLFLHRLDVVIGDLDPWRFPVGHRRHLLAGLDAHDLGPPSGITHVAGRRRAVARAVRARRKQRQQRRQPAMA